MTNRDATVTIDGDSSGLTAALKEGADAVTETTAQIKESLESVRGGFETLTSSWTALAGLMAGGEIGEALAKVAERAEGIKETSETLGMSTQQLQGLQVVAAQSGVSSETLGKQMEMLQGRLAQAGEAGGQTAERFNALGLTTAQLRDPALNVADAMATMGAATNSNAAIMAALGPRAAALIPLMRELAENHNAAAEAAQKAGALTATEIADLQKYQGEVQIAATQWDNFKARVLGAAIPAFEAVISGFGNTASAAGESSDALDTVRSIIVGVGDAFIVVRLAVQDATDYIAEKIKELSDGLTGLGKAAWDALHGKFSEAGADAKQAFSDVSADMSAYTESLQANARQAAQSFDALKLSMSGLGEVHITGKKIEPTELLPDLSTSQSQLKQWADEWKIRGQQIRQTLKDIDAGIKEAAATESAQAKGDLDTQLGAISTQQAAVKEMYKSHQISAQDAYQQDVALIQQELVARMQYFASLEELAAGDQAKLTSIRAQEAAAQMKYLQQMQQANASYASQTVQPWQNAANLISGAFSSQMTKLIEKAQTATQAVSNFFNTMVTTLVSALVKLGAQIAAQYAAQEILGKKQALSDAAQAAIKAGKSAAEIPVIGWILAAPAAAAVFAVMSGYSAQGGFDIPAGLEPVTQLHSREMVLPEKHADTIRSLSDEGGGGRRGGDIHLHVHAADGASVKRMFLDNKHALADTLRGLVRDGHLKAT